MRLMTVPALSRSILYDLRDRCRDPIYLRRPHRPEGIPQDRLPEVRGVFHGLIPGQLSHSLDVALEEQRPRVLGGVLSDLIGEARVVPDQGEAPVRVLLLPGAVEHLRLDLVVLSSRLTPSRVQGLIEVLHEMGGLAYDEEHIPEVSS